MPTLVIDGQEITVEEGTNLVQAAEQLGNEVPHYCYHPGLTVAGNCRMCLVEIEKMPKLQIACNTKATDGMVVHTKSEKVLHAREAVLEFLLINHPIDCPICDQAGECKLQDYYMDHDRQESRIPLQSKVHKGKAIDIGPMIMLDQERCILCTRCTRFLDEVTGTNELGIFQRGNHSRIDLFPGIELDNPYSGNVADICPVGALTNKDFRFRARVWYLERTPSVCPGCATGCNIDIHHRRDEMFRFRPRHNPEVNSYWMCDEGRLTYKRYQGEGRLLQPVRRSGENWQPTTWDETMSQLGNLLSGGTKVAAIVSAQATNEEIHLLNLVTSSNDAQLAGHAWSPADATRDDYLIDADKNPNSAGLRAQGLDPSEGRAVIDAALAGEVSVLLLWRTDLSQLCSDEELDQLGERLEHIVSIDTHYTKSGEIADLMLPIASFAETEGSFTNRKDRVQSLAAALRPPGQARSGWEVLASLSGEPALDSAADVFAHLAQSLDSFRGLSSADLGATGQPLASAE